MGCVRPVVHVEVRDLEPLDARHAADVRPRHFWVRAGGLFFKQKTAYEISECDWS
eukprot:COSAG01_NODE_33279_length_567_cov_0.574786_2_plen_54_part_01